MHMSSSLALLWMGTVYYLCDVKGKHKVHTTSLCRYSQKSPHVARCL